MTALMNGSHFAKKYVNDYLTQDLPIRLIRYRNGWNLDSTMLPDPGQYIAYEPLAIDEWPSIITVTTAMNGLERIGFDGSDPLYRVSYSMRTYIWVRDEGNEPTTVMRDRLTTVVRSALLDYPCLKAYDSRTSFRAVIGENSIREEYSDISLLKGERMMAGAYISYMLEIDEVVTREPLGVVDSIEIETITAGTTEEMPSLDN
jgi:hypothetical protein